MMLVIEPGSIANETFEMAARPRKFFDRPATSRMLMAQSGA
jgi:hypothetical protein